VNPPQRDTCQELAALEPARLEAFVIEEARLLDEDLYLRWLELWSDEGLYWIPAGSPPHSQSQNVALVYEDVGRLRDRVDQLVQGNTYSSYPPSRRRRVIGSFEHPESTLPGQATVLSNFVLVVERKGEQTLLAGRLQHVIRQDGDGLQMLLKRVELVSAGRGHRNFTFLL
jgi:benzoate/toluate 1,2-dioxygenase subunit beta